jgi:tripartite-type tricarboxylate transporter receptor subunit TctC
MDSRREEGQYQIGGVNTLVQSKKGKEIREPMKNEKFALIKILGVLLAFSLLVALSSTAATAASYPEKPIRLIVPYAPGGSSDIVGRLLASGLTERLGKQVVTEFHGGGGSVIGTELVARSAPDGYTLLTNTAAFTALAAVQKLPYDPIKDFTFLARTAASPNVFTVHSSVPVKTVKEFIALAKQKPGQLIFASSGMGGSTHMGLESFKLMADIDVKIVHFKGGGPALIDHVGGHSHAAMLSLSQPLPHIQSGKLRLLASCGEKRTAFLPDTPTIAESGVPGFDLSQWFGLWAPAGVPAPIVERLANEVKVILNSEEMKKRLSKEGVEPDYLGSAEFAKFAEQDIVKWTAVVKKANIKLE